MRCWSRIAAVGIGVIATCVLREDRTINCWRPSAEYIPFAQTTFSQISEEGTYLCALTEAGTIACEPGSYAPPSNSDFIAVDAGHYHSCGLRSDGTALCWGDDFDGSVTGPNSDSGGVRQIAVGQYSTCALRETGAIHCWGYDLAGEIAAANAHPASDGHEQHLRPARGRDRGECWGNNDQGQLAGLGQSGGVSGFTALAIGDDHICGLRADTSATCWGADEYGESSSISAAGTGIASLHAGVNRTCLIYSDGTLSCFGWVDYGANGDPWVRLSQ